MEGSSEQLRAPGAAITHDNTEVYETFQYITAYEQCTVPQQHHFRDHAELDVNIIMQLTHLKFPLTIEPNVQAKLNKLVVRIYNTWIRKYGSTFGGVTSGSEGRAPATDTSRSSGVVQPASSTWRSGHYTQNVEPPGIKRRAGEHSMTAFVAGTHNVVAAPTKTLNDWPPGLPQRPDFTFRYPPPTEPRSMRDSRLINDGRGYQPLFAAGEDSNLTYFLRYQTLDDIRTEFKRERAERLLERLPGESVARCMEALWRCESVVEYVEQWLVTRLPSPAREVIQLLDTDDDEEQQTQQRAKKKQKISRDYDQPSGKRIPRYVKNKLDNAKKWGSLEKPSKKAMSSLREDPTYQPFTDDQRRSQQMMPQSAENNASSSTARDTADFISLDKTATALPPKRSNAVDTHNTSRKRPSEAIDLPSEDYHTAPTGSPLFKTPPTIVGAKTVVGRSTQVYEQHYFGSARTVTPEPAIRDGEHQTGLPIEPMREGPTTTNQIPGTTHWPSTHLQAFAMAAQNEQAARTEQAALKQTSEPSMQPAKQDHQAKLQQLTDVVQGQPSIPMLIALTIRSK